jgi:hypothetical protein
LRIIGEIPHPQIKITLFAWNNKYIIKLDRAGFEQTFKVPEFDLINEDQLTELIDETFLTEAINRFEEMEKSLFQALQRT